MIDIFSIAGVLGIAALIFMSVSGFMLSRKRQESVDNTLFSQHITIELLKKQIYELEVELAGYRAARNSDSAYGSSHQNTYSTRPEPEPDSMRKQEIASLSTLHLSIRGVHSHAVIRKAYKSLIKASHPDQGGDVADFLAIKNARDFLMKHHPVRPGL